MIHAEQVVFPLGVHRLEHHESLQLAHHVRREVLLFPFVRGRGFFDDVVGDPLSPLLFRRERVQVEPQTELSPECIVEAAQVPFVEREILINQSFTNDTLWPNRYDVNESVPILLVTGGESVVSDFQNHTIARVVSITNITTNETGRLVALADSFLFSNTMLGGTFTEPTDQQQALYALEFFLFENILLIR